jgi:hypothetical protein
MAAELGICNLSPVAPAQQQKLSTVNEAPTAKAEDERKK